jgi:hypothetical protein
MIEFIILIYLVISHILFISHGLIYLLFLFDHLTMKYISIIIGFYHYAILIIGCISIY